jgi:hypothetical protein
MTFELSPSLVGATSAGNAAEADAYELKFRLPADEGARVEAWARQRLVADSHGQEGTYATTSLYCDTSGFDVFHRSAGFRRNKFRLRRYESGTLIYLERKRRQGDRVRKRRDSVSLTELPLFEAAEVSPDWPGQWFHRQLHFRDLRPSCWICYQRTAFMGSSPNGTVRLTLDRDVAGMPATSWDVPRLTQPRKLVSGDVILELKFRAELPPLFRDLLDQLSSSRAGVSKYRLCVEAWGLATRGG